MTEAHVEYLSFTAGGDTRDYTLRVRRAQEEFYFTLAIPNEAFLTRRVRYQDAPEICFLKLRRELSACGDGLPETRLTVTDADLAEYRAAQVRKPSKRRPRPPLAPQ